MTEEIWKPIPGILYREVSNLGRVRIPAGSPMNNGITHDHHLCGLHVGNGNLRVNLPVEKNKFATVWVAKLVMTAFVGEIPENHRIYFRDNNRLNCALDNLYYGLKIMVDREYVRTLRLNFKLTTDDIHYIREHYGAMSLSQLADMFHVDQSYISLIKNGKRAKEVQ